MTLPAFAAAAAGIAVAATAVVTALTLAVRAAVVAPWRQIILKLRLKYALSGLNSTVRDILNKMAMRQNGATEGEAKLFKNDSVLKTSFTSLQSIALEVLTDDVSQELAREAASSDEILDDAPTPKTTTTRILKALKADPEIEKIRSTIKDNLSASNEEKKMFAWIRMEPIEVNSLLE